MLKYRGNGLYKALSIILAVAMLLASPISMTPAYALEDEPSVETDIQSELPLDTSEEAKPNEILDSGVLSEASSAPAFAENYPKLGMEQADGSKKIEVLIKGILPEDETSMGLGYVLLADGDSAPTAEQIKSAGGKIPGVTIITWAQQLIAGSELPITLTGVQDDTDYEFYAVFWKDDAFSEVGHLAVKTPIGTGEPVTSTLAPPTGLQWDTAGGIKAKWNPVENATSYDVTLYKEGSSTMLLQYPGLASTEVSFQSNIVGKTGNYHFTVQAKAEGYTSSMKPASPIYSYIAPLNGSATIDNMNPKIGDILTGSLVYGNNTGTLHYSWKVDGEPVGANAESYTVTADDLGKTITLEISSSVETGTLTSNATAEVSAAPTVLEVTTPEELEIALGSVSDGGTIALSNSINYDRGIEINAKSFHLDLGSYMLDVVNSTGIGIDIKNAVLTVSGDGKLNATGTKGIQAHNSKISVYSATGTAGAGVEASYSSYAGGVPCEVMVMAHALGTTAGVYAMNDNCKITAGSAKATAINGRAVYAEVGGTVEISGDVEAPNGYGVYCVNSSATIGGTVTSKNTAIFLYEKGSIVINGDVIADNGSGTAVEIDGSGVPSNGTVIIEGTVSASDAFYVRFVNGVRTKNEGVPDGAYLKYMDSIDGEKAGIIRVKKASAVCTIDSKEFTSLSEAITAAPDGETTTITLLQSITHNEPVEINGKSITFALGDFDLTIDTSAISNSTALWVLGDGKMSCTGSGKLHVMGSDKGVRASGGSELHISGNITARQYAVMAGSASDTGTPKITVDGDVTVTGQDVNTGSEIEAVSVGGYATITIGGNVTANRTDAMQMVTAVYSNASTITIGKNVTTQGSGVNAQNGGNVTIGGALHYNPTGSNDQAYIKVGYPIVYKTADDYEPTSIKPEYKEYKNGDNIVWVKEAPAICTIGAQKFTSLDAAIASVPAGGRATITMLQSITHTKHIMVEKKTINLDLMDYNLLLDTSANTSYSPALMVIDGGKVNLIGSGTGEFNIKSHMTAISAIGMNTKATVHNVVAGDSTGVNMVGSGDYLDSSSTVTVLGSITVGNGNGVEVNAKNGKVVVGGNITAGRIGVNVWSNPGTQVTVNGDITVDGDSSIAGIWAYGATTVAVTGDVTVRGTNCVGVHASGSTIKVDGSVASSGKGAHSDTNGKIEITGSLSAGSPFITVETTEMTADQGTKTDGGSLLYTDGANTVQIGSVGVPGPIYTITIQNDGNGTASANVNSAAQGKEITLTASANGSYRFKEWQVISGGVIIKDNKFTMPANNVTIKAVFEETSVQTYTLTVNGSHASTTGAGSYTKDAIVNIYAGNLSNYTFAGWTSSDVTITGASSKNASFVMPGKAVTVTANWSYNGGGEGGSGGGGGGYTPTPIIPTDKQPDMPTVAKPSVSGIMKDGILSATITEQMVKDAIKAAQDAAKKSGKELDGIALDFNVTGSGSYTSLNAAIDARAIERLKEAGVKFIKIGSAVLDVTLDMGAIAKIDKQSNGTVTICAKRLTKLSDAAKKLIGNRPVFDITVSYQKNGKTEYVSNFGKGAVTLGIAYKATVKESKGNLFGIYVDKDGKPQLLTNSSYDNTGRLIFSRNSLSTYGVGYKAPAPAFTDTAKHWAKDNIDFVASRDLISGASATTFAPNTDITRADFLMALGRLSGADVSGYKVSSFSDVKATDTAMPYIEWAVKNKIVSGYGNGKFGPNDSITREQMAVMMVNYARATGYKLPVSIAAVAFADNAKISSYAKDAVKAIQQTGVINGKHNNRFDPQGNTTRAEAATILRRFVELVIDEGTARGWVKNDAGHWQWIGENGKPAIGWLTTENGKYHYYFTKYGIMVSGKWLEIDGKWYYFNADGSLAKDTKVDGYEVGPDGVRKTE